MEKLSEMFKEANGQLSSMRLYCAFAILAAFIFSIWGMCSSNLDESLPLIISWMSAGFGGKAIQKFSEHKSLSIDTSKVETKPNEETK